MQSYPNYFMRIKTLSTLIGAGILALSAGLVLEKGSSGIPESGTIAATDFEDTSSLIEYSLPAPTAEPPAKDESKAVAEAGAASGTAEDDGTPDI